MTIAKTLQREAFFLFDNNCQKKDPATTLGSIGAG
jgi:hypothetical protein